MTGAASHNPILSMHRRNKAVSFSSVRLCCQTVFSLYSIFDFFIGSVKYRVTVTKSFPVLTHSVDFMFWSFGTIQLFEHTELSSTRG